MRKTFVAGVAMAFAAAAYAQTAEDAFGVWENPENKSHTEFYKCGDNVCAKIVKVADGQKTDDKNPDPAKRSRPIVGLVITVVQQFGTVPLIVMSVLFMLTFFIRFCHFLGEGLNVKR